MENNWLKDCVSSGSKISSKRVVTLSAFLLLAIAFISNLFFDYCVEPFMYEGMMYIVIGGVGFTASEYFARNKSKQE